MNKQYQDLAKDYKQRKRMQKLAGIGESVSGIRPEVRQGVEALNSNIRKLADELQARK